MTLPQAMHALGVKPSSADEPPTRSEEDKAEDRCRIFDAVCVRHKLTAADLAGMPPPWLANLLRQEGHAMIDLAWLPKWTREYLSARGGRTVRT